MKSQKKSNNTDPINYKKLSIQISLNGLSFCILDDSNHKIIALKHIPFEGITNPIQLESSVVAIFEAEKELLNQSFHQVTVSHINSLSTLVPKPLFSDKNLADYLKYNTKILDNDYITFDVITNNDMVNVYIPYVNINNFIFDKYGAFHYKHFATVLLENLFHLSDRSNEPTVYVHVQKQQFEIIVIQQKKLLLYNTFEHTSSEDFIYYLLFTIEQLELNPNELPLYFLGDISKGDILYTITYTYVRNVFFLNKKYDYSFAEDITPKETHTNFTLLNNF